MACTGEFKTWKQRSEEFKHDTGAAIGKHILSFMIPVTIAVVVIVFGSLFNQFFLVLLGCVFIGGLVIGEIIFVMLLIIYCSKPETEVQPMGNTASNPAAMTYPMGAAANLQQQQQQQTRPSQGAAGNANITAALAWA